MRLVIPLVLCAACGGKPVVKRPPSRTPYLMLFEQGRTFTLPAAGGAGDVSCTVTEVKQVGDANVSQLRCAPPHQALLIAGTWVSLPSGLYHPYIPVDDPDELAMLGEDELLIAANAADRDHNHALDGATHEAVEAFEHEGSWCVRHTTTARTQAGEQARSYALCFDGKAITGGSDAVTAADENQRVQFGRSPPDDPAEE